MGHRDNSRRAFIEGTLLAPLWGAKQSPVLWAGIQPSFTYLITENVSDTVLGYEVEESKKYLHDLELYGGKTNVLAVELMKWFNGLWHGRSLAYTIGCITILFFLGFCLLLISRHLTWKLMTEMKKTGLNRLKNWFVSENHERPGEVTGK